MPHLPVILSVFFHGTVRDSRTPAVMNLIETTVLRTGVEACPYTAVGNPYNFQYDLIKTENFYCNYPLQQIIA